MVGKSKVRRAAVETDFGRMELGPGLGMRMHNTCEIMHNRQLPAFSCLDYRR